MTLLLVRYLLERKMDADLCMVCSVALLAAKPEGELHQEQISKELQDHIAFDRIGSQW